MIAGFPNLRRTLLIAKRDFVGYIKTWGFWISFLFPLIGGAIGVFAATLDINLTTSRYEAILDDSGLHAANIEHRFLERQNNLYRQAYEKLDFVLSDDQSETLLATLDASGVDAARDYLESAQPELAKRVKLPIPTMVFVDPPAPTIEGLQPYLRGEQQIIVDGEAVNLDGVLHLTKDPETGFSRADYWSSNINSNSVLNLAQGYFSDRAADEYLAQGNLNLKGYKAARSGSIAMESFNPNKQVDTSTGENQAVTIEDKAPFYVAIIMSGFLWLTIFSGSYMLLTSMLEEKLNKLLEMMLSSVQFSEVILGKLLGVAALTIMAMLPYILLAICGVVALVFFAPNPELARGVAAAFPPQLVFFFCLYLVLGYVFYGAMFIAIGSLAQSMQDAQTLTTPIILILTACIMIIPVALNAPDSEIVRWASLFPLSAPFAAIIRLPSNPPLIEMILPAVSVFILTIGVIYLAGRIFRYGVLSGSGVASVKAWFNRVILRRKAKG
ncbi:MAG: ABC transporter permease [Maricaulaceae bacterium]